MFPETTKVHLDDVSPPAVLCKCQEKLEREEGATIPFSLMERYLTKRECRILILYYGLDGQTEMTRREIGELFGITARRVRDLQKRALEKLFTNAGEELARCSEELGVTPADPKTALPIRLL